MFNDLKYEGIDIYLLDVESFIKFMKKNFFFEFYSILNVKFNVVNDVLFKK